MFADDQHLEVQATWGIYERIVAAYRNPDRTAAKTELKKIIATISSAVPATLTELTTLHRRAADVLAYFDRPGTEVLTDEMWARLDARHRTHDRVEDRIRCGKDTGIGRFPSREFQINRAWMVCALTAIDLFAWTHANPVPRPAGPRTRRAEDCPIPAPARRRTAHPQRPTHPAPHRFHWPWADALVTAFQRLRALPLPAS